ncbi:MAG: PDZ domain-containing protein [Planctomycetaceae bacterium]|nr:PDZ domain-containing protein [Planctomycetaceae bacterium]
MGVLLLSSTVLQADPPGRDAVRKTPDGGLKLDIGRFTPYARGLKINIGPKRDGERSVDVQVRQNGYIPVNVDVNVNPELRGPAYAERPDRPLTEVPEGELLGEPSEPNLLGSPEEGGPQLLEPGAPPSLESAPTPDEESSSTPVPLEAPPEPGADPLSFRDENPAESSVVPLNKVESASSQKPYLGVSVRPISAVLAAQFRNVIPKNTGLQLTVVGENSPAEEAGLKQYDVIVAVDGQPVGSLQELVNLVNAHQPGDNVSVSVLRASRLNEVVVELGSRDIQVVAGKQKVAPVPIATDPLPRTTTAPKLIVPLPDGKGTVKVEMTEPGSKPVSESTAPRSETSEFYTPRRSAPSSSSDLGEPSGEIELPSP